MAAGIQLRYDTGFSSWLPPPDFWIFGLTWYSTNTNRNGNGGCLFLAPNSTPVSHYKSKGLFFLHLLFFFFFFDFIVINRIVN